MATESVAITSKSLEQASLYLCNARAVLSLATDDMRDVDNDVVTAMFIAMEYVERAKEQIDSRGTAEA